MCVAVSDACMDSISLDDPCDKTLRFNVANNLGIVLLTIRKKESNAGTFFSVIPEAIQMFDIALEENPDSVESKHNQGLALQCQGRHQEAIEMFGAVLDQQPGLVPALLAKLTSLQHLGELKEVAQLASELIKGPCADDFRPYFMRGSARISSLLDKNKNVADFSKHLSYSGAIADMVESMKLGDGAIDDEQLVNMQQTLILGLSKQAELALYQEGSPEGCIALCNQVRPLLVFAQTLTSVHTSHFTLYAHNRMDPLMTVHRPWRCSPPSTCRKAMTTPSTCISTKRLPSTPRAARTWPWNCCSSYLRTIRIIDPRGKPSVNWLY